ncbi:MAG: peptidoglycan editing factor PgeF [PVC group bacterium]|nr:peptidoglycan editing factor PgeF [PVC group bacterium]
MQSQNKFISLKKTVNYYQIEDVRFPNLMCVFSTRIFDYSLHEDLGVRQSFFIELGLKIEDSIFLEQPHQARVFRAKKEDRGKGAVDFYTRVPGCDAVITEEPGTALCLLTADCLPLFFFVPGEKVLGIAHAGWRGTQAKIAETTVNKLCQEFDCFAEKICVYIGPGIGPCCYRVGKELRDVFPDFVKTQRDGLYFDLAAANTEQLVEFGINRENIYSTGLCTSCKNDKFFSYRRGDKMKRMLSVAMLKP